MEKLNVAVLFGGESVESDISIITGFQVYSALNAVRYNKYLIYIDGAGKWWLCENGVTDVRQVLNCKKEEVTLKLGENNLFLIKGRKLKLEATLHCAVLALHGGNGESGAVQGLLKLCGIPFTSSGVISSGLTLDKCVTKQILKGNGIPTLPFEIIRKFEFYQNQAEIMQKIQKNIDFPLIIKPATLGSSIGIKIATNAEELLDCVSFAFKFDNKVLVESALTDFYELNISARSQNGQVLLSQIEKPIKTDNILSFENKYKAGAKSKIGTTTSGAKGMAGLKREFPAKIDDALEGEIRQTAKNIYTLFDCAGIVRCDFLVRGDGKVFLNEVNSIPGSLSFYLWGKEQFSEVLDAEISSAIKRKLLDDDLIKNFDSKLF